MGRLHNFAGAILIALLIAGFAGAARADDLKAGNVRIPHSDPGTVSKVQQPPVQAEVDGALRHMATCWTEEFQHHVNNLTSRIVGINAHILRLKDVMQSHGEDTETPNPGTADGADLIESKGDAQGLRDIINKLKHVWRRYCPDTTPMMDVHPLPKAHRKPGSAVSEDNPLYKQDYKAPANKTPPTHKKPNDSGTVPSQSDVDRQTDQPSNDSDKQPNIPVPH
jgi:hypothetical protein